MKQPTLHNGPLLSITVAIVISMLGGCSSTPTEKSLPLVTDAIPKKEPLCKYGNMSSYKVKGIEYRPLRSAPGFSERGIASWYGPNFNGKPTSCMETYDMYKMTAAHKTLPLPSYVEVTNLDNNKKIVVRVNDRGPFHEGRIIDLSYAAALKLNVVKNGTAPVSIRVLTPGESAPTLQDNDRYLQLGIFSARQNAEALSSQLAEKITVPVQINSITRDGKQFHQVMIDSQPGRYSITTIRDQLKKIGIEGMIKKY